MRGRHANSLRNGLAEYWRLDEASGDALGLRGHTLTDNNTVTQIAPGPGILPFGRYFNPANSEYLSRADEEDLSFGSSPFLTTAGWFWLNDKAATGTGISKWGASGTRDFMAPYFDVTPDRFQFWVYPDGISATLVSANNLGSPVIQTWYFIVCQRTKDTISIQVNNLPPDFLAYSGAFIDSPAPFHLGQIGVSGDFWSGAMAGVGVWKRNLTPQEILFLYNRGRGRAI